MSALAPWQQRILDHACAALAEGRLGHALLLLGPQTPMLFMGEEWGASTPWQYFTDHQEVELAGTYNLTPAQFKQELDRAVSLYEEAYREVQRAPTLEVLQRQAGLLSAAEALEKRVERIQSWPFDEATFARVVHPDAPADDQEARP